MNKSNQFSNSLADYADGPSVSTAEVAAQKIQLEQEKLQQKTCTLDLRDPAIMAKFCNRHA